MDCHNIWRRLPNYILINFCSILCWVIIGSVFLSNELPQQNLTYRTHLRLDRKLQSTPSCPSALCLLSSVDTALHQWHQNEIAVGLLFLADKVIVTALSQCPTGPIAPRPYTQTLPAHLCHWIRIWPLQRGVRTSGNKPAAAVCCMRVHEHTDRSSVHERMSWFSERVLDFSSESKSAAADVEWNRSTWCVMYVIVCGLREDIEASLTADYFSRLEQLFDEITF